MRGVQARILVAHPGRLMSKHQPVVVSTPKMIQALFPHTPSHVLWVISGCECVDINQANINHAVDVWPYWTV